MRCNSVHPSLVETDLISGMPNLDEFKAKRIAGAPLGRIATADDVAYGVLYLASDEWFFVTSTELVIDGGTTAQ